MNQKNILALPVLVAACLSTIARSHAAPGSNSSDSKNLHWTDVREFHVEGRPWLDTASYFDRLPARAEKAVRPPVWSLSHDSAGMLVRFVTDATNLHARWVLRSTNLAMPHMAATGVSGLDLYVRAAKDKWRWLAVGKPLATTNSTQLFSGGPVGEHEFLLYLPLYNGISSLEIGVPIGSKIQPGGVWGPGERKPILFYGTSILQGGCASRPGMAHVAIIGRQFNWPTINLGFSGNGKMDLELADLFAELDPAVYVLDCIPNMTLENVRDRVEPFVRRLRSARPKTPIVLVEGRSFANEFFSASAQKRSADIRAAYRHAYEDLRKGGIRDLYYLPGDDGEATVDGSHPTDLGFTRQAKVVGDVLRPLLKTH